MKFRNKEECQKKNCCAYANYLLNEGIKNYYKSQNFIFEYYNKYMNDHSNKDIKDLCGPEINVMEEDKYEKIKKLYTSYYLYKDFISKKYSTPPCYNAILCANTYNKIITEHSYLDDTEFCKAVNSFKNVFENDQYILTKKCGTNIPELLSYPDTCNNVQEATIQSASFPEQHTEERLEIKETSEGLSNSQQDQIGGIRGDDTASPSSLSTTLPISLFSSGAGVLITLLSFYKVNNNSILESKTLFLF